MKDYTCTYMLNEQLVILLIGQFHDLQELFRIGGECPDTNYLFMGMKKSYALNDNDEQLMFCFIIRRFCGSWSLFSGNFLVITGTQSTIS